MTKQELEAISNPLIQGKWKPKVGGKVWSENYEDRVQIILRLDVSKWHATFCYDSDCEDHHICNEKDLIWLPSHEDLKEIARERLEKKGLVVEGMRHPKSDRTMDAWEQINYWFDAWYDHEQMVFNKSITEWLYNSTTELEALARWVISLEGE